jgi:hypothetical protein
MFPFVRKHLLSGDDREKGVIPVDGQHLCPNGVQTEQVSLALYSPARPSALPGAIGTTTLSPGK